MDALDARILRELWRDQVIIWGGLDPRLGTIELASRLEVDRTTVWARLKAWREEGFLVRQEVVPHPALLGAGVAGGDVRVTDPRRKAETIEALERIEGVLCGVDQVGEYILLLYAMEDPVQLERCRRLLADLPHVAEVSVCIPFEPPQPMVGLTSTDWRILEAFRRCADGALQEVAALANVSRRTLTRRYARLLEARALWSFPVFDFTRYRGAVMARFTAILSARALYPGVVNACRRELPEMVWWDAVERLSPSAKDVPPWVDVYCHLGTAAEVDRVHQRILEMPAVVDVDVAFPGRWFVVPSWFDRRIEAGLRAAAR